jgi:hypothetical protein
MAPTFAIVERVASMPKQGVSSTFKFGAPNGAIRGVLAALQIRTHLVSPAVWKKYFQLDSDKEKSRALALRTWYGLTSLRLNAKKNSAARNFHSTIFATPRDPDNCCIFGHIRHNWPRAIREPDEDPDG